MQDLRGRSVPRIYGVCILIKRASTPWSCYFLRWRLFCLHAPASICALVFIDGEAGEHVNTTYWCGKDNMYYFLKPPISPYLKFQTGVHTPHYINSIQWITVKGVKPPDINCHNEYEYVLYWWAIRFVPDVGRICCALTSDFSVSIGGRFLLWDTSWLIRREVVCGNSGWRHILR